MSRPVNFGLFARRRSWLRRAPRFQRWLRDLYLQQRSWALKVEDDMILCRVLGRYKMYVDPQDRSISPHLMIDGYWEQGTTETLVDLTRHGMVTIDVGANLGYFTLLLALLCGPRGRVLAFEPNPPIAARLRASLLLNGLQDRVDLHETVLGESDGQEVNLLLSANHPGGTQVTSLIPDEGPNFLRARTRRLDGIEGALDATLVKIDAEGMEESIWHGMTAMIAGDSLRHVLVEFTPASYRDPAGWLDEVAAAGFTIAHIDDELGIRPITRATVLDGTPQRMLIFQR